MTILYHTILLIEASVSDPSSYLFDCLLRLAQILSTGCRVLIVDQICLVIPDPCYSLQLCLKTCQQLTHCYLCWMMF